jgi:polysaccharide biosynthesis/export protein
MTADDRPQLRAPRALVVCLLAFVVASCHNIRFVERPKYASAGDFVLGPGDVIQMNALEEQAIQFQGQIGPTGEVGLPILGTVNLLGMSLEQARLYLSEGYRKYIKEITIVLAISHFRSEFIHVMGEVGRPGTYPMTDGVQMTAIGAVQQAGSYNVATAAYWKTCVIRGALDSPRIFRTNIEALQEGVLDDPDALDIILEPGDIVYVPPRWVTDLDRFVRQFLSPISSITGAATGALIGAGAAAGGGGGTAAPAAAGGAVQPLKP